MFLEKNLASIEKRYPAYAEAIRNTVDTGRYQVQRVGKNRLNLIDRATGNAVYNNADPMVAVKDDIKGIHLNLFGVFIGFGLGYHIIEFRNAASNQSLNIIFEKDYEAFRVALTHIDYKNMFDDSNTLLCLGNTPETYYSNIYKILNINNNKLYMRAAQYIPAGAAFNDNKEYYSACIKTLGAAIQSIFSLYGNDPTDSLIGIEFIFQNIDEILNHPGVKDLKDIFKGKPGIVVSTGPSLNKNIELLREIGDRAVISGPDASLKVMQAKGLKPHFVTSLERVIATAKLFEGQTVESTKDVFFFGCPVVHPQTYKNYPGERVVTYRDFATFQWLDIDRGMLPIGPSASNMAFKVLEFMGCDPIILMGQDLAFAGDKTHATGSTYGEDQSKFYGYEHIFEVEGNLEPTVRTTRVWELFLKHFVYDVANFAGTAINATEGGAKILGTTVMPLREAIDKYIGAESLHVVETIRKNLKYPSLDNNEERNKLFSKVEDAIIYADGLTADFNKCVDIFNEFVIKVYNPWKAGTLDKDAQIETEKYYKILEDYLKRFNEPQFFLIFMHYVQPYFIKIMNEYYELCAARGEEISARASQMHLLAQLFEVTSRLIESMKPALKGLLATLKK